MSWLYGM